MKLPFWEEAKPAGAILGPALEGVLDELCDRKQLLLLATPYLQYESRFLERTGDELRIRATMGREAVRHTLTQGPVRLRFPWALSFFSGPTRVLEYVQEEGRRSLRVEMPRHLVLDEQRRAFRVDRTGASGGAMSDAAGNIVRLSLESISITGAGAFCIEPLPPDRFQPGRMVDLSLSLEQGFVLVAPARICHLEGQSLGLVFQPPLPEKELQRLAAWIAPREQDARRRWENRAELRAKAELAARPRSAPAGVLLVSPDAGLKHQLAAILEDLQPVRAISPAMIPFKEAAEAPPLLLLVDVRGEDIEGRYRLRALVEGSGIQAPVIVLGTSGEPEGARILASDLKAFYLDWNPQQDVFFRRLVQGLIQKRWGRDPL